MKTQGHAADDVYELEIGDGHVLTVRLEAKFSIDYEETLSGVRSVINLIDVTFRDARGNNITAAVRERHTKAHEDARRFAENYLADDALDEVISR